MEITREKKYLPENGKSNVSKAADDTRSGEGNSTKPMHAKSCTYTDATGRIHRRRKVLKACVLSGVISWIRWESVAVTPDLAMRPRGMMERTNVTAGFNVVIPCTVMKRLVDVNWMHGKPLWFKCVKGYGKISNSEYISVLYLRDIRYGQVVLESSESAPFFVLKYGDKKSSARLHMLQFCMSHCDYRRFRDYVRGLTWKILNGDAKVDLTVLRLSVDFIDFVKHPKVAALFDLDKAEFIKQIKVREQVRAQERMKLLEQIKLRAKQIKLRAKKDVK